jgi:hypothetical protein
VVARQAEPLDALAKLGDRIAFVPGRQLAANRLPDVLLGRGVLDGRGRLPRPPHQRGGGDLVAARAVGWVVGAWVVVVYQMESTTACRSGTGFEGGDLLATTGCRARGVFACR